VQTAWQTGLYLQDQIKLYQWILTLGSRYDWATLDTLDRKAVTDETRKDQALTKRVGLGYEFETGACAVCRLL
jgi:iron complex outermembrane recepter protein